MCFITCNMSLVLKINYLILSYLILALKILDITHKNIFYDTDGLPYTYNIKKINFHKFAYVQNVKNIIEMLNSFGKSLIINIIGLFVT